MGRTSDLVKNINTTIIIPSKAPNPPNDLTLPEAEAWIALFESLDANWIAPSQYPLVAAYARHVASADNVSKLIEAHERNMSEYDNFTVDDIKMLDRLQKMLDRQNRAISSILTKLRATNQSLRSDKSPNPVARMKPWETPQSIEVENDDDSSDS